MPSEFSFRHSNETEISNIKAGHLAKIPPEDMANLKSSHMEHFRPEALKALKPEHLEKIPPETLGGFKAQHFEETPPPTMTALKVPQAESIQPEAMSGLKAAHLAQIPSEVKAAFTPEQISQISPDVVSEGFTSDFLSGCGKAQLSAFTPEQISQISPDVVSEGFTSDFLSGLSTTGMNGITPEQFGSLNESGDVNVSGTNAWGDKTSVINGFTNEGKENLMPPSSDDILSLEEENSVLSSFQNATASVQAEEQQGSLIDTSIRTIDETIAAAANEGAQNIDVNNLEGRSENQQQENDEAANLL